MLCLTKCGDLYNMRCVVQYMWCCKCVLCYTTALCPTIVLCFTICVVLYNMCCVVKYMLCYAIVLYNICGVVQCVGCYTMCVVSHNM